MWAASQTSLGFLTASRVYCGALALMLGHVGLFGVDVDVGVGVFVLLDWYNCH